MPRKLEVAKELQESQASTQIAFNKFGDAGTSIDEEHASPNASATIAQTTARQSPRGNVVHKSHHRPSRSVFVPDASILAD